MVKCSKEGCKQNAGTKPFCLHHKPDEEYEQCSICHDPIKRYKEVLDCNHSFHRRCIDKWFDRSDNCPMCRASQGTQTEWQNFLSDALTREFSRVNSMLSRDVRVEMQISFTIPAQHS